MSRRGLTVGLHPVLGSAAQGHAARRRTAAQGI